MLKYLIGLIFFFSLHCLAQDETIIASKLIEEAVARSAMNDPREVLESFGFQSYEKTVITDSLSSDFHNFFSEKVSELVYTKESKFSEEITGYQLAGFKNPRYEVFAVNVQSRSFYDSDFVIFNNRYSGIFSERGLRNYNYEYEGITSEGDYIISFAPKKPKRIPGLTGTMVLDKDLLAIKDVKVKINDGLNIILNQTYAYFPEYRIYLPQSRELFLDKGDTDRRLSFFGGKISIGTIQTDALEEIVSRKFLVSTTLMSDFRINQPLTNPISKYAITFQEGASERSPEFWQQYREEALTSKDKRSFSALEKIVSAENIERRLGTINNFSVGYFSVNAFDFDLTYPLKFNNFEGLRLGVGGVTNAAFSKRFRLEGYLAYGFKDAAFKYGFGGGYLLNSEKGAWLSLTYNDDLEEVGNYSYLTDRRVYSLFEPRLVNIVSFYKHRTTRANLEYRIAPQLLSELQVAYRDIDQIIPYRYIKNENEIIRDYNVTEVTASFRWSPSNKYLKTDSDVVPVYEGDPIISGQVSQGVDGLGGDLNFTKLGAKLFYRVDRLNKTATEFLVEGNIGFGDLPVTHLFQAFPNAPNKETVLQRFSVAGVNSFETMFFGEFYSDKLLTAQIKHRLAPFNLGKKFKPEMVFISRFAIGDIQNPQDHLDIEFDSLRRGYTETGFEINKLIFGFGTSLTYRYGAYHLPNFADNIAFKFTFNLKL